MKKQDSKTRTQWEDLFVLVIVRANATVESALAS